MGPKHIFLFILDAVRKDHLSLYGYQRKTTPNIDKLAKQAEVYNWAFAPAPYTLASVPSILAGKYPIELSNAFTSGRFEEDDFPTLLELKKQGYTTAMFTANIVTSSLKTNLNEFFDYFWDNLTEEELNRPAWLYQKAEVVLTAVEDFVKKHKKDKLFVVIHLMEAHGPYVPQLDSIFKGDELYRQDNRMVDKLVPTTFRGVTAETLETFKVMPKYQAIMQGEDYERRVAEYIAKYDMGIYQLDKNVGAFCHFLEKEALFNNSQLVFTADHGELMGEENIFFSHGILAHPVLSLVPLIIKQPKQAKRIVNKEAVSLIDIMPAIVAGRKQLSPRPVTFTFHPKSIGVMWSGKYIVVHNGEFSDIETTQEDIFPVSSRGLDKILRDYKNFKSRLWLKGFRKIGNKYVEDKKMKREEVLELFKMFLKWQQSLLKRLEKELLNPRRSERLAVRIFLKSLTRENLFKRLREFGEYRWRLLIQKLKV